MNRAEFLLKLEEYLAQEAELSEEEADFALASLEHMAPNSDLSDIIYYGDKDRNASEIVDEALLRQALWNSGGRESVRERIKQLMKETLADQNATVAKIYSAQAILKSLEREEQEEAKSPQES
ncbi:hypothetical protein [Hyphomonas oceanitis]|uniref:Uncharacterized protein n=1 Tax=Hyphomonas oceanitis SCH89 TaxID=1280953 RepID=A0A059GA15_9PROT|nr:hypothetical protein [Hyphomonas oceanitis]KDA03380.1 hypothetical protein HOC_05843 [Hyphomonas oceanitis SCH89]